MSSIRHPLVPVVLATGMTAPWLLTLAFVPTLGLAATVILSGLGILGASFLLAWGAETAEADVPRSFAIAVLAVIAVAPEYAVDALYAWTAGVEEGTPRGIEAGNLAIANMTGANRILIGLGWSGIALFTLWRARRTPDVAVQQRDGRLADEVVLDRGIAVEIVFLAAATVWAFLIPFGGGIDLLDTLVLVGLYVAYILIVLRSGVEVVTEHVGVPAYLQTFPRKQRIGLVIGLFAYSGAMILLSVESFAHGLEDAGLALGIPKFFMIQWIAPLASESPELVVVVVLVMKARSTAGFNTLISSKLNQWTLLIGTLAIVYSIALGSYGVLEFDSKQSLEIWLTAAQSYYALAILANFKISGREAVTLLGLFLSQVVIEFLLLRVLPVADPQALSHQSLLVFTAIYLVLGTALFVKRRESVGTLLTIAGGMARRAVTGAPVGEGAD